MKAVNYAQDAAASIGWQTLDLTSPDSEKKWGQPLNQDKLALISSAIFLVALLLLITIDIRL